MAWAKLQRRRARQADRRWRAAATATALALAAGRNFQVSIDYPVAPSSLTAVQGRLFFAADDGIHGKELWRSDGTRTGTVLVRNISSSNDGDYFPYPTRLTAVGGRLFFSASDDLHGTELWRSNGRRRGTFMVRDINLGGLFTFRAGTADPEAGTMKVPVTVDATGQLVAAPVDGSEVRRVVRDVASPGRTSITLEPTEAGRQVLEQTGELAVQVRFSFTPCGGVAASEVREYTLTLQ